ncbi:hypothetical protein [Streptomyces cinereoruber]|uniref:hypothetical protein n=1 Tax=Streptomyces cinereoruber TaxID=67260 RepID=UPI00363E1EA3
MSAGRFSGHGGVCRVRWPLITATKLRWGLTVDPAESEALKVYAEACETTVVHYNPAP